MMVRWLTTYAWYLALAGLLLIGIAAASAPLVVTRRAAAVPTGLVLLVSGDTAGWITPCGCSSNQSGGLMRRGTYVADTRREAEVILADAGGAPAGTSPYQRAKFEAILAGEVRMSIDAHNLGGPELALGGDYLRDLARRLSVPFVSANAKDAAGPLAEPVRIVEAQGVRVALAGVVSPRYAAAGITVDDPQTALAAALNARAGQYDTLVVLAYMPEDELVRFAESLPEADVVVGGPTGQSIVPRHVGPVLLTSSTNKGKFLVHLSGEKTDRRVTWSGQVVELGPQFMDDPDQQDNHERYLATLGRQDFPADRTDLAGTLPAGVPADYRIAGSESCRACHPEDYALYRSSPHAMAWRMLRAQGHQVDPYCQQCHTTGYGLPGGFVSMAASEHRTAVGCESCHGPSEAHGKDPNRKTTYVAKEACIRCHDHENSPLFDYDTFYPLIRHGQVKGRWPEGSPATRRTAEAPR